MNFKSYLSKQSKLIESHLTDLLPKQGLLLVKAMKYSLMAGGKRLRPVLVLEAGKICGAQENYLIPAACALEYIHTYSLIHDDLPAMDNDDLRRGKPTSHKKFDEATAILAGDALLTDAFLLLAMTRFAKPENIAKAVGVLAFYAGSNGMVKGQSLDVIKGGAWRKLNRAKLANQLNEIHLSKTAALIKASLAVGAVLAGASDTKIKALMQYGENIGLAFQITDDILDVVGNKKLLGKKGSDRNNDKLTYASLYGLDKSRQMAIDLITNAKKELKLFGIKSKFLVQLADYILERQY